ncbi:MAG: hypothetical protein WC346_06085 [Methanogenium sp.]|jgi:hypothetical protein
MSFAFHNVLTSLSPAAWLVNRFKNQVTLMQQKVSIVYVLNLAAEDIEVLDSLEDFINEKVLG